MTPAGQQRASVEERMEQRDNVGRFFSPNHPLRAVIEGVLETGLGSVAVDQVAHPRAARLSLGCYEIFGGDAAAPAALRLMEDISSPRELVYGNDPAWRN